MSDYRFGPWDKELQMYIDQPHRLNLDRLRFLRWLAEHGQLEHETASDPAGELAVFAVVLQNDQEE